MNLVHLLQHARTLRAGVAAAKAAKHGARLLAGWGGQARAYFRSTFEPLGERPPALNGLVPEIAAASLAESSEALAAVSRLHLDHRFDLLGSGWIRVEHGMRCPGFEGHRYPPARRLGPSAPSVNPGNRARARAIRARIDPGYRPLDWQIDFKSGYRWSEARWSRTVPYGHRPGVDIKVPWELARLQHLPGLALAFIGARAGQPGFGPPAGYVAEFRNQTLDFLAANPPGFGVNWACTMDVAIRAANLALAWDLFRRHGAAFDPGFLAELHAALVAHGKHIAANLEWHATLRANHYLADIAGLLFVAAYLARDPVADCWLAFAVRQLVAEVERQFTPDGANFEASTNYHRLSAEIVVYATALVLGLPGDKKKALADYDSRAWSHRPSLPPAPVPLYELPGAQAASPFPPWYFERLERMAEFTRDVTKPNGRVVQIGDCDSGRFFKLSARYRRLTADQARRMYANLAGHDDLPEEYWDETPLDHRGLIAAVNGLFGRDDLAAACTGEDRVETLVVQGLAGGVRLACTPRRGDAALAADREPADPGRPGRERRVVIGLPRRGLLDGLRAVAYPDFGLYIWSTESLFVSLRCGPVGQSGNGGHAHNDQLAMELNIDGEDWLADPGSYVYTASPGERNRFRSVRAHAAPRLGGKEPGRLDLGLFRLEDNARARCLGFDKRGFHGVHFGYGVPVYRIIAFEESRIVVRDGVGATHPGVGGKTEEVFVENPAALRKAFFLDLPFSPGYGKLLAGR